MIFNIWLLEVEVFASLFVLIDHRNTTLIIFVNLLTQRILVHTFISCISTFLITIETILALLSFTGVGFDIADQLIVETV